MKTKAQEMCEQIKAEQEKYKDNLYNTILEEIRISDGEIKVSSYNAYLYHNIHKFKDKLKLDGFKVVESEEIINDEEFKFIKRKWYERFYKKSGIKVVTLNKIKYIEVSACCGKENESQSS